MNLCLIIYFFQKTVQITVSIFFLIDSAPHNLKYIIEMLKWSALGAFPLLFEDFKCYEAGEILFKITIISQSPDILEQNLSDFR